MGNGLIKLYGASEYPHLSRSPKELIIENLEIENSNLNQIGLDTGL